MSLRHPVCDMTHLFEFARHPEKNTKMGGGGVQTWPGFIESGLIQYCCDSFFLFLFFFLTLCQPNSITGLSGW